MNTIDWRRLGLAALAGSAVVTIAAVHAQGAPAGHACANASSQMQLNICADAAAKQADAGLNRTYGQVMARLTPAGRARLRDAQHAWLLFRDKECTFESSGSDAGSVSPMVSLNCMQSVTNARAHALALFRVCEEGDVSCPQ